MGFSPVTADSGRREPLVTITSPIAGTVIERTAAVDAPVGPESVLFTIADLTTLWLTVRVPETSAAAVKKGQTVKVSVGALPDRSIDGHIDYVSPVIASGTRTVDVRIQVPNRTGELRPGMSANARFDLPDRAGTTNHTTRVLVPRTAVQELNQATVVFVPDGERKFKAQPVTLGSSFGNDVELLSGLNVGDRLVVQGAFTLKAQALRGAVVDPH
jgi:cobalt-zinc-cadmium efflux system membrane fusion protein